MGASRGSPPAALHRRPRARRSARCAPGTLALAAVVAACGAEPPDPPDGAVAGRAPAERAAATADARADADSGTRPGYTPAEVLDGGTIRGTIRYTGDVPPPRTVDVPDAAARCGTTKRVASLEVGPGGALANAVVSLLDIRRGSPWDPSRPSPTLDQRGCEFVPHVLAIPVGGPVRVLNSDPLTHNVRTAALENRSVNRMQPPDVGEIELAFAVPERVKVGCDLHSWMSAWIVVSDHPYVAVTDERGRFSLPGAPPGTYTLEIWHEALGARTLPVRVVAGEATEVSVDLSGRG